MIYPSFSGGGLSGFDSVGFGFCSVGFGAVVLVGVGSAGFVVGVGSAGFGVGDGSSVAGTGVDVIVTVGVILGSSKYDSRSPSFHPGIQSDDDRAYRRASYR